MIKDSSVFRLDKFEQLFLNESGRIVKFAPSIVLYIELNKQTIDNVPALFLHSLHSSFIFLHFSSPANMIYSAI